MEIKVELEPGAIMPSRAHEWDAGFDLYIPKHENRSFYARVVVPAKKSVFVDTGVHMELPRGYRGILVAKSGLYKKDILTTGLVDAGYTGTIGVTIENLGDTDFIFKPGQKISQITIDKIPDIELVQVEHIDRDTERGEGGFGSTGLN